MVCELSLAACIPVYCLVVSVLSPGQISLHLLCMEIKFILIPNHFMLYLSLFQLFLLHHAVSSPSWMKPRSCWNGASPVTWAGAKTLSTTSSVRSACPSGECALGVMTMWIFRRATWAWPSAEWLSATSKLTHSTASRFKQSMGFPTRARIRLSSPLWTSPPIRLVGKVQPHGYLSGINTEV